MALTNIQGNVCDTLVNEFSTVYSLTNAAKSAVSNTLSSIVSTLTGLSFTPLATLSAAIDAFNSAASGLIPGDGEADIDDLISMISSCSYLNDNESLKNPISLVKGIVGPCHSKIDDLANDYAGSYAEFEPANGLKQLTDLYSDQGIKDSMSSMDKIINCVGTLCGSGYAAQLSTMTSQASGLYSGMKMISDPLSADFGKVDLSAVYSSAGLDASEITKMTNTVSAITTQKDTAVTKASSLVDKIKARF